LDLGAKVKLVFKKCREDSDNVIFIDASQDFIKSNSKNYIREEDVNKLINTFVNRKTIDKYSYLASTKEIAENQFFLNISRYVKDVKEEEPIDTKNISEKILKIKLESDLVDKKITQYCKKLDINSPFDENIVQKIFSQEIRFKNKNGKYYTDWQEVQLKDVLTEHKIKNNDNENKISEVFSVAKSKGVINQIEHLGRSYASEDLTNYKVVHPYDIVYTKSPTSQFPFGIIKSNQTGRTGVVSTLYAVFRAENKNISLLLDYYFSSWVKTYNYLYPIVNKGVKNTMNINNDVFLAGPSGVKIKIPSDSEEQEKLVEFFKILDKKLELLSKELNLLTEYQKSLLLKIY